MSSICNEEYKLYLVAEEGKVTHTSLLLLKKDWDVASIKKGNVARVIEFDPNLTNKNMPVDHKRQLSGVEKVVDPFPQTTFREGYVSDLARIDTGSYDVCDNNCRHYLALVVRKVVIDKKANKKSAEKMLKAFIFAAKRRNEKNYTAGAMLAGAFAVFTGFLAPVLGAGLVLAGVVAGKAIFTSEKSINRILELKEIKLKR